MRIDDAEYPPEYRKILKAWLDENNLHNFELELIEEGLISPELKKCLLGLDYILESRAPGEDMVIDVAPINHLSLRPKTQLRRQYEAELERLEQTAEIVADMELTAQDFATMNPVFLAGGLSELSQLGFPEPVYSDLCRNSPEDLRMSHLRKLREDGYFDNAPTEVRVAAYLMVKGFRARDQVESFAPLIEWGAFQSAQGKIYQAMRKTWPERFARFEKVIVSATTMQQEAFALAFDIDDRPTRPEAAARLGISISALNARLTGLRQQLEHEFAELTKRAPKWMLPEPQVPLQKVVPRALSDKERAELKAWLRSFPFPRDANVDLSGSKRGEYRLERGECAQHPTEWRVARLKGWIKSNLWPTDPENDQHEATEWAFNLGHWGQERERTPCDRPPKIGEPGFRPPSDKNLLSHSFVEDDICKLPRSLAKIG